ncbi:MAG: alpha/beta hydrolase fold domain-containing protein [Chitinophagaceae bacterium]
MKKQVKSITVAVFAFIFFSINACSKDNGTTVTPTPTPTPTPTTEAQTLKDVVYATSSSAQKMDIYIPAGAGPFPAVVLIHGGAFKAGDKSSEATNAAKLVANGYVAISINYRLSGEAVFPAAVHDCKAAIRFVRANAGTYRINANKLGTWGASAGGNLSAILGTSGGDAYLEGTQGTNLTVSSTVQATIDWFGPINFATMVSEGLSLGYASTYNVDNESQYIGVDANNAANISIVNKANPTTYIDVNDPPFWIQVGSADPLIPYTQSLNFYNSLKAVLGESKVSYELINGAGHGGSQFSTEANLNKAIAFFDSKLK